MSRNRLSFFQVCLQGNSFSMRQHGYFLAQFTSPFGANLLFTSGSMYALKYLGVCFYFTSTLDNVMWKPKNLLDFC